MRFASPLVLLATVLAACADSPSDVDTDVLDDAPAIEAEPAVVLVSGVVVADGAPAAQARVRMIAGYQQGEDPFSCEGPEGWSVVASAIATTDAEGAFTAPLTLATTEPYGNAVPFCLLTFTSPAGMDGSSPQHFPGQLFVAGAERATVVEIDISHLVD